MMRVKKKYLAFLAVIALMPCGWLLYTAFGSQGKSVLNSILSYRDAIFPTVFMIPYFLSEDDMKMRKKNYLFTNCLIM